MDEPVGSKRPLPENENDALIETIPANKKLKKADNVKKVAEIVLVLATMGKMRGGRKPTPVEVKMMSEAREMLAEICQGFSPKQIFPTDCFRSVIDDLGLKESKLGVKASNLSIAQRIEVTKQKMEKSEVFPVHSAAYTPNKATEPRGAPSGKPDNAPVTPAGVRASPIQNSRNLPYQLPTSEIRPGGSSSHLGRHSTASPIERAGRPQLNANLSVDHKPSNAATRGIQSQSALNKGPAHMTNINHHMQHRMNSVQSSAIDTHNEIGKLVKKILQAQMTQHHTWTPPSREYMNKAITCQNCKIMIKEIDNALICDACEKGYHLRCLQCNIKELLGDEWREWHCAKCLTISNGKPIPPKYGRVMRNINTPKVPPGTAGVQPSVEKKPQSSNENFDQRLMTENGNSGSQNVSSESMKNNNVRSNDTQVNGAPESNSAEQACESKPINVSESQKSGNSKDDEGVKLSHNGLNSESNKKAEIKDEEGERGNIVKSSESYELSSSSMHNVEWVGDVLNEVDGKKYYRTCSINGTTYQLQDYVLFSSNGNNIMPNKLQGMWEDNKTNKKWVTVTRCFFPDDLPKGIGRPCAPESNEVYESNHETTLAAGLIHGPCEVLPPRKFSEVKQTRSQTTTTATDKSKPLYLCKWFYDEKKQLFRDVTC